MGIKINLAVAGVLTTLMAMCLKEEGPTPLPQQTINRLHREVDEEIRKHMFAAVDKEGRALFTTDETGDPFGLIQIYKRGLRKSDYLIMDSDCKGRYCIYEGGELRQSSYGYFIKDESVDDVLIPTMIVDLNKKVFYPYRLSRKAAGFEELPKDIKLLVDQAPRRKAEIIEFVTLRRRKTLPPVTGTVRPEPTAPQ